MVGPTRSRSVAGGRRLAAALGAVVLLAVVPVGPASAQSPPVPRPPMPIGVLCAAVPAEYRPFVDVAPASTFADAIRCQAYARVTLGVAPLRYAGERPVDRAQMASFVARLIDTAVALQRDSGGAGGLRALPAHDGSNVFTDVDGGGAHVASINRLAAVGITRGGPGGLPATSYGPSRTVTRGQMASFVNRAIEYLTGRSRTSTTDHFTDDDTSEHEANIDAVADVGIAVGVAPGRFRPDLGLRRDQMAAFTTRTLAHLEVVGAISPLPPADPPIAYVSCGDGAGFAVSYPEPWSTDGTCRYFHPHPFEVPPATDANVAAVVADVAAMAFDELGTPGLARDVSRIDLVIDGRRAARFDYVTTDGLFGEDIPVTTYHVDMGEVDGRASTLTLSTIGTASMDHPRNRIVLDRMAATVQVGVG